MTVNIIAPYNFVPLSKKVFAPDWAYSVSHDVPLKDSVSGFIDLELTNHGDICVGARKDSQDRVVWARDPEDENRLVIPGSSVKGMLRNVLEIVSLARLTPESMYQVRKFWYRELLSDSVYMKEYNSYDRCCGWLKYDDSTKEWKVRLSKNKHSLVKIFDDDLNKFLGLTGNNRIINHDPAKKADKQDNAQAKYEKALKSRYRLDLNQKIKVLCIPVPPAGYTEGFDKVDGSSVSLANTGDASDDSNMVGYVVFSNYRVASTKSIPDQQAKAYSYVFPADNLSDPIKVESSKVELFTGSSNSESVQKTYNYLREHQNRELGIPVWAFLNKDNNEIKALGFARMPRLVCRYDTQDVTAAHQTAEGDWKLVNECYFSLPEVMFGTVRKEFGQISFKSRISFSDMTSDRISGGDLEDSMPLVLNSPKPSFYNMYLEDAQTYSSGAKPPIAAGFKRYRCQENSTTGNAGKDSVTSILEVLKNKKTFIGKIMFHNLKKEELGALLWCLSFGESLKDTENSQFYHSLGHGKPYGLGAVQFKGITVKVADYDSFDMKVLPSEELNNMMESFAALMDKEFEKIGAKNYFWKNSVQVEFLKSLARLHHNVANSLVYNELGDFRLIKKAGLSIPGVEHLNSNDKISRKISVDPSAKLNREQLAEKYFGNVNYRNFIEGNPRMPNYYEECKAWVQEKLKAIKAEAEKQEKLSEISCEVLRDFISKFNGNLEVLPSVVQAPDIRQFLMDMIKAPQVNDDDKVQLESILKSGWFSKFVNVSNKKNKDERKALVRQVKEKHGIQ